MKERPILFNGEMVRAVLEGRKTQTRRVLATQPPSENGRWSWIASSSEKSERGKFCFSWLDENGSCYTIRGKESQFRIRCPYGTVGDRLWVRETWKPITESDTGFCGIQFKAGGVAEDDIRALDLMNGKDHWRPSIHMPRWASRITLEITGVRVERLNDISEADAAAEGCDGKCPVGSVPMYQSGPFAYHYAQLWESINGSDSWAANPWVWVITFRKMEK
jgi:hypothetical protein